MDGIAVFERRRRSPVTVKEHGDTKLAVVGKIIWLSFTMVQQQVRGKAAREALISASAG